MYAAKRDAQAARVVALGRSITDDEWQADSLCAGWRVADVYGHLVSSTSVGLGPALASIVRHRSVDRAELVDAVELASAHSQTTLLDRLERSQGRLIGPARVFPARMIWLDLVVHELDIRWPLGSATEVDPGLVVEVLDVLLRLPNPFVPARGRAKGLTLRTTDVSWQRDGGPGTPVVEGPAAALLLAVAGRTAGLSELRGSGVETLVRRIGSPLVVPHM